MGTRSRCVRFRPWCGEAGLECRVALTGLMPESVIEKGFELSGINDVNASDSIDSKVTPLISGIHGASRPARSIQISKPVVRMARRHPARPAGPIINPARNVSRVVMPAVLPAQMTATSTMQVEGAWSVRVTTQASGQTRSVVVNVPAPEVVQSTDIYAALPVFDPSAFGWLKGQRLAGVSAQEGVISGSLDPGSVFVTLIGGNSSSGSDTGGSGGAPADDAFIQGVDYEIDPVWGTIGRLPGGRIGEFDAVTVTYSHVVRRLDAVILQADGQIVLRAGVPSNESPVSPVPNKGEKLLGRVFHSKFQAELNPDDLFPVLSTEPAANPIVRSDTAASLLPDFMRKLKSGREVRILAWGDSVTDGQYLGNDSGSRWQDQFVSMLKRIYPRAKISLSTEAWPGHGTADYLASGPNGSSRFDSAVIGAAPDLVISEFVNDGYMDQAETLSKYTEILDAFRRSGIDWIVMTPHFTHPAFMGFSPGTVGDADTRPYVAALKMFASNAKVPLADASAIWADLKRQGLPYTSLLSNGINHPGKTGLKIYAEALAMIFAK
ncbi:hypothetical protein GC170_10325 [bacterium]|nr:hypothetical protein [bacterium]